MANGKAPHIKRLPDLLIELGVVDRAQMQRALMVQKQSGRRLLRVIVDQGWADEDRLVRLLSQSLGLESVSLSTMKIHERVLARVPRWLARRAGVLPIAIKRANQIDYLYVVMSDPLDVEVVAELQRSTGCQLSLLVASPSQLDAAIDRYYGPGEEDEAAPVVPAIGAPIPKVGKPVRPPAPEPRVVRGTAVEPEPDTASGALRSKPARPVLTRAESDLIKTQFDPVAPELSSREPPPLARGTPSPDPPSTEGAYALPNIVPAGAWDDDRTLDVEVEELDPRALNELLGPAGIPPLAGGPQPLTEGAALVTPEPIAPLEVEAAPPDFVSAWEVPVDVGDKPSPFDGLSPGHLPAGLERTGIIPVIDWDREEFEPPLPEAEEKDGLVGIDDIPISPAAVRARAQRGHTPLPSVTPGEEAAEEGESGRRPRSRPEEPVEEPPRRPRPGARIEEEPEVERRRPDPAPEPRRSPPPEPDPEEEPIEALDVAEEATPEPEEVALDEELTPARDRVELAQLAQASRTAGEGGDEVGRALVAALRSGRSLNSAERAQLVLALGRLLLDKGLISDGELAAALSD